VKRLAVTMGDPAGVGPEIIARALADPALAASALVVGDLRRLTEAAGLVKSPVRYRAVASGAGAEPGSGGGEGGVPVLDLAVVPPGLPYGGLSAAGGEAAYRCLVRAIDLALAGEVAGIVTAPLNKEALHLAGHRYPGHTEILAHRTAASDWVMTLAVERKLVLHATAHIPYAAVPRELTGARILRALELGRDALRRLGVARPRMAVAGLNPHAGEGGIFGDEELRIIAPAVREAQARWGDVTGPVSPDTVFLRWHRGEFDAVVAMYHDQGHIPVKLLAFESGVQLTLGLPLVRTSVDHGTAYGIAGRGVADAGSLDGALRLARLLAENG
jgi:4-phospho-D-threonate 3-dehydrogenase / 4-phospho-D-erythronate 3-dehydrogenase